MQSWFSWDEPVATLEWSAGEARKRVASSLDCLNDAERLVLVLYEFEELSGDEIARVAGCPVGTM